MRVAFSAPPTVTAESFARGFQPVATAYDFDWQLHDLAVKPRVLILVSKFGHCLNDLLYRHSIGHLPMELVAVVSNHETMRRRVEAEGLPYLHLPVTADTRDRQEAELSALIEAERIDLVVLARYMQVLSTGAGDAPVGPRDQHPPFLPAELRRCAALSPGARARRQADRRHRPLRDARPRRGTDHRAGRRARRPRHVGRRVHRASAAISRRPCSRARSNSISSTGY